MNILNHMKLLVEICEDISSYTHPLCRNKSMIGDVLNRIMCKIPVLSCLSVTIFNTCVCVSDQTFACEDFSRV